MTQEDVENHKRNVARMDDNIQKIISPKVVRLDHFRTAIGIKRELLRRISFSKGVANV